jgi:hypothetical protein
MRNTDLRVAVAGQITAYRRARRGGDTSAAWNALERAHILSQPLLGQHLRVHALMLGLALRTGDAREVTGQLARLALAPLGALTGRMPWGNNGRSNVSAFKPMPIPDDLQDLLAERPRNV